MSARAKAKVVQLEFGEVEALLERLKAVALPGDVELVTAQANTLLQVTEELQKKKASIARLRRLLGITLPKGTSQGLGRGKDEDSDTPAPSDAPSPDTADKGEPVVPPPPEKLRPKGHGRLPSSAYEPAETVAVPHPNLHRGDRCPGCVRGNLHGLSEPARITRLFGQAPLVALVWECDRLRCGSCGHVFVAPAPEEARGPKYSESAVSMTAILHYGTGLPFHRLARLQQNLRLPLPASTQWQIVRDRLPAFLPVYDGLVGAAADADLFHNDDTHMGILELMGKRRAKLEVDGELLAPERTGLFTSGIVAKAKVGLIALFMTGRKHAGENLRDVLDERDGRLPAPVMMSDGLDHNAPKGHEVVEAKCLQHARKHVVEEKDNFPEQCGHVLAELKKVFKNEQHCKRRGVEGEERRRYHQEHSGPVMAKLRKWIEEQFEQKMVEPNSGLGQALNYMLKRWEKLTAFLRVLDAPLENNRAERALKRAIIHRNNSLFYRTRRGAHVGDVYMALIYTAELHGVNPFEYLTALLEHEKDVAEHPEQWMPWNYAATLERLREAKSRAA